MKPAAFDYYCAQYAEEAMELLARFGDDARLLAGGQSLMPMLNMRLARPASLIDISDADDLRYIHQQDGYLEIGAAVTQTEVQNSDALPDVAPLLAQAIPWIAHPQIRNRGTLCGSIAHADPAAELPLCALALDAQIICRSQRRRRSVAARDFFQGTLATVREADELIEAVRFPVASPSKRYAFGEVAMRHGDFALVALAVIATDDYLRIAVGGIADRPMAYDWGGAAKNDWRDALRQLATAIDARDDQHASAAYRRHVLRTLGERLIDEVLS